ncbi:MAG: AAA family ATPase [Clostridium beijerinckii]|nr:AAA family ATPase [Clostridium beijerinckii]
MYIKNIDVKNFTVFENLNMKFCKGINVFIGENGTGKTHLMKMMYAPLSVKYDKSMMRFWEDIFTHNTDVETVPHYFRRNKNKEFIINIDFDNAQSYCNNDGNFSSAYYDIDSVFIPAKEMLSHSKGFLALERERHIPFDRTLIDIISKSELGKSKRLDDLNMKILNHISNIIEGEVIYENDTFYILKNNGLKIEFSMEAEGIRKIGVLWQLIQNGLINNKSILFWDEPEANINPKFIPDLVEILIKLQTIGVQIFVTTHDYILSKYFDVKRSDNDEIMYFSLYRTDNGVEYECSTKLDNLKHNQIRDTFIQLYEDEIERAME